MKSKAQRVDSNVDGFYDVNHKTLLDFEPSLLKYIFESSGFSSNMHAHPRNTSQEHTLNENSPKETKSSKSSVKKKKKDAKQIPPKTTSSTTKKGSKLKNSKSMSSLNSRAKRKPDSTKRESQKKTNQPPQPTFSFMESDDDENSVSSEYESWESTENLEKRLQDEVLPSMGRRHQSKFTFCHQKFD